jgi:hypothetical protein
MATTQKKKPTRTTQKAKMEALKAENEALKQRIDDLIKVNSNQLQRLVGEDLLRAHIKELKAKLGGNE